MVKNQPLSGAGAEGFDERGDHLGAEADEGRNLRLLRKVSIKSRRRCGGGFRLSDNAFADVRNERIGVDTGIACPLAAGGTEAPTHQGAGGIVVGLPGGVVIDESARREGERFELDRACGIIGRQVFDECGQILTGVRVRRAHPAAGSVPEYVDAGGVWMTLHDRRHIVADHVQPQGEPVPLGGFGNSSERVA